MVMLVDGVDGVDVMACYAGLANKPDQTLHHAA